ERQPQDLVAHSDISRAAAAARDARPARARAAVAAGAPAAQRQSVAGARASWRGGACIGGGACSGGCDHDPAAASGHLTRCSAGSDPEPERQRGRLHPGAGPARRRERGDHGVRECPAAGLLRLGAADGKRARPLGRAAQRHHQHRSDARRRDRLPSEGEL
ncbi:MAG: hypothetical protein AVDCRST_MAG23-805, partial [uncultured Sphingosinicella sp.]